MVWQFYLWPLSDIFHIESHENLTTNNDESIYNDILSRNILSRKPNQWRLELTFTWNTNIVLTLTHSGNALSRNKCSDKSYENESVITIYDIVFKMNMHKRDTHPPTQP